MSRVSVCRLTQGQRLLCCVLLSAFHRKGKDDNRFGSSSLVSDLMMTNGKAAFQILLMPWITGAPGMSRLCYLDIILGDSNTTFKVSIHVTLALMGKRPKETRDWRPCPGSMAEPSVEEKENCLQVSGLPLHSYSRTDSLPHLCCSSVTLNMHLHPSEFHSLYS